MYQSWSHQHDHYKQTARENLQYVKVILSAVIEAVDGDRDDKCKNFRAPKQFVTVHCLTVSSNVLVAYEFCAEKPSNRVLQIKERKSRIMTCEPVLLIRFKGVG